MLDARMESAGPKPELPFPNGKLDRARAGLLHRIIQGASPLTWPNMDDAVVELEESMVKWRHAARMVERIIGRRVGTGGSSGVDYLDGTAKYRIF